MYGSSDVVSCRYKSKNLKFNIQMNVFWNLSAASRQVMSTAIVDSKRIRRHSVCKPAMTWMSWSPFKH